MKYHHFFSIVKVFILSEQKNFCIFKIEKFDKAREVNEIVQHKALREKLRLWLPNIKRHLWKMDARYCTGIPKYT